MTDGASFNITNHDMMFVKRGSVLIGTDLDEDQIFERFVECAILHIIRLEEIELAPVE